MIKSLSLVNWKSHASTSLTFGPGTNIFIGSMGSGKTSCLEAICYVLYGTFPALKSHKVAIDEVVTVGQKNAKVTVTLVAPDGNEYLIERTIAPNGGEANLRDSTGKLLEGPQPKRTSDAILNLLNLDYDLFTRAIYSEQNKIDHFITLAKGERKKQLDSLLGLDAFETARASAVSLINNYKNEQESLQAQLDALNPSQTQSEKTQLESKLVNLKEELKNVQSQLHNLTTLIEFEKTKLNEFEKVKTQGAQLQNEIVSLKAQIDALSSQASSLSKMEVSHEAALEMQKVTLSTLDSIKNLSDKLGNIKTQIGTLEGQKSTLLAQNMGFDEKSLEIENKEIINVQNQINSLNLELKSTQEQLTNASTQVKLLTVAQSEYAAKQKELEPKQLQVNEFNKKYASIEILNSKITALESKQATVQSDFSLHEAQFETLKTAAKLLDSKTAICPTCDSELSEGKKLDLTKQKAAAIEKTQKHLTSLKESLTVIASELKELKNDKAKWDSLLPFLQVKLTPVDELKINEAKQLYSKLFRQVELLQAQLNEKQTLYREQTLRVSKLKTQAQNVTVIAQLNEQITARRVDEQGVLTQLQVLGSSQELMAQLERIKDHLKRLELESKATTISSQVLQLEYKKTSIKYDEKEHELVLAAMQSKLVEQVKAQAQFDNLNLQISDASSNLEKLNETVQKIAQFTDSFEKVQKTVHELTIYSSALIRTQETLRNELIGAINEALKSIWLEVYPYGDYTSLQLLPSKTDYEVQIKRLNNEWIDIERVSGGEKTCAALSLRVALSMVLAPSLSWLVLDEPTHNLDANAVNLLARALHDSIPRIVRQTFIITHDEKLKEAATASVHKFERNKNQNQPTTIEQIN